MVTFKESQNVGQLNGRIAGGHIALPNQFPYQVAVTRITFNGGFAGTCGGSIISPNWVLSAAHCLGFPQYNLRFGSIDRLNGGVAQTSFKDILHPLWETTDTLHYDIGLILLSSSLHMTYAVSAIRLPSADQMMYSFTDQRVTVAGWGSSIPGGPAEEFLLWVSLRVIDNDHCRQYFTGHAVVDHVVCAWGYTDPNIEGTCGGDSGGPLTIIENGVPTQIGLLSFGWGFGCGNGFPSGFTRTTSFLEWINTVTGLVIRPYRSEFE